MRDDLLRTFFTFTLATLLIVGAVPALAEDGEPTAVELATLILDGNEGEQVLVATWLKQADRALLLDVFKALRALKAKRGAEPTPLRVQPLVSAPKEPLTMINAEVRVIDVAEAGVASLFGKQRPTAERPAVPLTAAEAGALLQAIKARADATLVSAPRITVEDGQSANVSVLNQVSYVKDYDVEVTKEGSIADPIIDVIQEGTVIDLRPTRTAEGTSIACAFTGTFAMLQRPIPELKTRPAGANGAEVTIQVPELRVQRVKTTVTLPDGGWVLIGGDVRLEPKKGETVERITLVHVRSLQTDVKDR